jgi:dihydroxyacetone kinase-like protein
MKKLINDPANAVKECLQGFLAAHSDLVAVSFDPFFVTRKIPNKGKVALISGGGSGHEPMHAGFVGKGMLDAACPGNVFTSPTPDQMEAAARAVVGDKGGLFIVKNYTGDIMNFEMAAEMVGSDGLRIATVIIDDDVAVKDSLYTAGRRGVGATVLTEKIAGASAERGDSLEKVVEYATYCKNNGRSMGMALTSCTVPAAGKPTFDLAADEIEMGVGIHGEPGRERMKQKTANELVDMMFEAVVDDLPYRPGEKSIVMVNGMGGTPEMELFICYARVAELCKKKGIEIARCLVGNYITSLEMQGFSLTLLKASDDIVALWDAPVHAPGLRWGV